MSLADGNSVRGVGIAAGSAPGSERTAVLDQRAVAWRLTAGRLQLAGQFWIVHAGCVPVGNMDARNWRSIRL